MFSVEFLNRLRAYEIETYLPYLRPGARILELGGGTGEQARQLAERGYDLVSVDLEGSTYSSDRVFPVQDYDGRHLPFEDKSFDIIFSSNVLEHIPHLNSFHDEMKRVLMNNGYCVHIMPTGAWRFWTSVANYVELLQRQGMIASRVIRSVGSWHDFRSTLPWGLREAAKLLAIYAFPPRHGETGNALTEIYTFSRRYWIRHFRENGYEVLDAVPMELFYTGHMVLGASWSMRSRRSVSRLLGSACVLYKVRPASGGF